MGATFVGVDWGEMERGRGRERTFTGRQHHLSGSWHGN